MANEKREEPFAGTEPAVGAEKAADEAQTPQVVMIPVELIDRCAKNRESAADASIPELAESIARDGLINPISLRLLDSGRYEIITGERRWRAHLHLKRVEIPAIVKRMGDTEAQVERLMENLMRKDLEPLEKGEGIAALLETNGGDFADAAGRTGWSESWVRRLAKLPKLIPEWREALAKEDTSYELIAGNIVKMAEIAVLPEDTQRLLLDGSYFFGTRTLDAMRRVIALVMMRFDMRPWNSNWDDSHYQGRENVAPRKQRCKSCSRRSDRDHLFSAVLESVEKNTDKTYCLDPACWKAKTAAWCQELIERHPEALVSGEGFSGHEGDVCKEKYGEKWIRSYEWIEREEGKEESASNIFNVPGEVILVGGVRAGKLVSVWLRGEMKETKKARNEPAKTEDEEEEEEEEEPELAEDALREMRDELHRIIPTDFDLTNGTVPYLLRWAVFLGIPSLKYMPEEMNLPTALNGMWDGPGVFWSVMRLQIINLLLGKDPHYFDDEGVRGDMRASLGEAFGTKVKSKLDRLLDGNPEAMPEEEREAAPEEAEPA